MGEAYFITKWKNMMKRSLESQYGKLKEGKINELLDEVIKKRMDNPKVALINNYRQFRVDVDLLSIIDFIVSKNLIIGGDAVLFEPYDGTNLLTEYIEEKMALRKQQKRMREKYDKGEFMWFFYDLKQGRTKIVINSLYGVFGYDGFFMHNLFLAQAVTAMGQNIITSAACAFENFMSDNIKLRNENEIFDYCDKIITECKEFYQELDFSMIPEIPPLKCYKRLINKLDPDFILSDNACRALWRIVNFATPDERKLLYYKNNFYEFNRVPFIMNKLRYIFSHIDVLLAPDEKLIVNESAKAVINDLMKFYTTFVTYNYPIGDKIRKTRYTFKKSVLYIDTDSNFVSFAKWMVFCMKEVYQGKLEADIDNMTFKCINTMGIFLSDLVGKTMETLCKYRGVTKERGARLRLKNEFYFKRILFTNKKKRYLSQMILQEGILLKNGEGLMDIKGFDFIKSTTKPAIRKKYEEICYQDILLPDTIRVDKILGKLFTLQKEIEYALKHGDTQYYRQANIGIMEKYKAPWSIQGIKAVTLWNTMCPDYMIELPSDVNLIPIFPIDGPAIRKYFESGNIKESGKKSSKSIEFALFMKEKFPDVWNRIEKDLIYNPNPLINSITWKHLATPKNKDLVFPEWFQYLVDTTTIVTDAINLFTPIAVSLGVKSLKTNSLTTHCTNIVEL